MERPSEAGLGREVKLTLVDCRIDQESKNVVTFELPGLAKSDVDISLHK